MPLYFRGSELYKASHRGSRRADAWASLGRGLLDTLSCLQDAIDAFDEAVKAEKEGRQFIIDKLILPEGLDYFWLRETADLFMERVKLLEKDWEPPLPKPKPLTEDELAARAVDTV
ncbi:hypothetical protein FRC02_000537 [Tulasnella sp. 418]|nr:hypothetical protein FRC02_000537 [Tulasnella sp. 418]